jgi:hypothetical protein
MIVKALNTATANPAQIAQMQMQMQLFQMQMNAMYKMQAQIAGTKCTYFSVVAFI